MLEPPWARSAMLLEELDPLRRASGNEAFACPVWRDRARRSQDHRIGSRELGPFFEILQPVGPPPCAQASEAWVSAQLSQPQERISAGDPGFSYCQHPWRSGRLGLLGPGSRARMPKVAGQPGVESQLCYSL